MPVFISYSHQDRDFAEKLAAHLVKQKASVWIDCWELKVGDSLIEKIQEAIKTASALLVVLSKASIASEWCKKELNAGLIRELEEKRVVVLPLLLEDCDIPVFLKDKKRADFRKDFDEALQDTLTAIAAATSDTQGRIETADFHIDWGIEGGKLTDADHYSVRVEFIDHSEKLPYSILTQVEFVCNEPLSRHLFDYERRGIGWFGRLTLVGSLHVALKQSGHGRLILAGSQRATTTVGLNDPRTGFVFTVHVSARRLGTDTGFNGLFEWADRIHYLFENLSEGIPPKDRANLQRAIKEGIVSGGIS